MSNEYHCRTCDRTRTVDNAEPVCPDCVHAINTKLADYEQGPDDAVVQDAERWSADGCQHIPGTKPQTCIHCARCVLAIALRAERAKVAELEGLLADEVEQSSKKDAENRWLRDVGVKRQDIVNEIFSETRNAYHLEDAWSRLDSIKTLCGKYEKETGRWQDVPLTNDRLTEKLIRDVRAEKSRAESAESRLKAQGEALAAAEKALEHYASFCELNAEGHREPFKHKPFEGSNQPYSECMGCVAKSALAKLRAAKEGA